MRRILQSDAKNTCCFLNLLPLGTVLNDKEMKQVTGGLNEVPSLDRITGPLKEAGDRVLYGGKLQPAVYTYQIMRRAPAAPNCRCISTEWTIDISVYCRKTISISFIIKSSHTLWLLFSVVSVLSGTGKDQADAA